MKSRKNVCASCLQFKFNKTIKSSKKLKPQWLDKVDYVDKFIINYNNFNINYPDVYDQTINIFVGKIYANYKILYWGAKKDNSIQINDAKTAYGSFKNSGVSKVDNYGFATIKFSTPQNYYTKVKNGSKNITFFKHIHYVLSNKSCDNWDNKIYTKLVHNNFNYDEFIYKLKNKKSIILNVLPNDIYAKDHINNTYNLPYNSINKMDDKELKNWFMEIIKLHYKDIEKLIKQDKIKLYEIPIICYCANSKCNVSVIAMETLMKKGYVNVSCYKNGMLEYKYKQEKK